MIFIFLPVHNRKKVTEVFIKSLSMQLYKDFQLVLIDDGSTDGTSEMVSRYLPDTIVINGNGNLWWAGALQLAYEWVCENLNNEPCLIINDDTVIDDDFIQVGSILLNKNPRSLILAQSYSLHGERLLDNGVHFDYKKLSFGQANNQHDINCLSTRGLFITASTFKTVGGFYPRMLPHYLSDYEFTIRAGRKGFKLMTSNELKLRVNQETTGFHGVKYDDFKSYYTRYFSNKNTSNPRHWLFFVFLTNPFPYNLINSFKVIFTFVKGIFYPIKYIFNRK